MYAKLDMSGGGGAEPTQYAKLDMAPASTGGVTMATSAGGAEPVTYAISWKRAVMFFGWGEFS